MERDIFQSIRSEMMTDGQCSKTFDDRKFTIFLDKPEWLSLAGISSLISCLWVRPGANQKVEHLKSRFGVKLD